ITADENQLSQALLNILINAWQAMPDGGNIYIETRNTTLDTTHIRTLDIKPGRYVRISISDTGIGMDEAVQQKIFEPFFTTKEMGRGTGLGLASSYGVIKNHGGAIDFGSQPGKGTSFYIYLPASAATAAPGWEPSVALDNIATGTETILLVDDEQVILDVNAPLLEKLGYVVLTARSGRDAIDIYRRRSDEIDLVVLDMIMPDLGGRDVFDRLKSICPDVKVLLSSGYSLTGQAESILARGCAGFIQKPFDVEKLSREVRQALGV
ncbi:MAG TPA: response regulator, partial [Chromatiaceae bacterium]|nr:response regulator [Chromatiaceae bacterium]